MTGLAMMLQAFGIKVSPEHIALAEREIPLLPQRVEQAAGAIQTAIKAFDVRLSTLEKQYATITENQLLIIEMLREHEPKRDNGIVAGGRRRAN